MACTGNTSNGTMLTGPETLAAFGGPQSEQHLHQQPHQPAKQAGQETDEGGAAGKHKLHGWELVRNYSCHSGERVAPAARFFPSSCQGSSNCCCCREKDKDAKYADPNPQPWRARMRSWILPQQVVPVEHARDCLCSLVGAIGARRPRPGAGAGLMGLAVGSFCCAAAATKMRASPVVCVALAVIALCGFARLFSKHVGQIVPQRPLRIVLAYGAAAAISSAAVTVAAVIAVATAARMYFRAAVDYGTRNEQRRWVGVALDFLERGALLLQMILMTQWVFGEFSVMPVMTTMGMMFALLHNCGSNAQTLLWVDDLF
eukprot:CAMPEP_0179446240 /NCGR_PEP_ID=MMETSP0799-20121207/29642_1 /TAXON_ID=46947 /ORGANISM="Geminigera cryophila, Strain CCMP2564" /LENGTH=315 /DNA_ID=CAMNT_0021234997 /DNA_START=233 /DNA_END=1180 /DNA_ORIENTATION=-